MVEPEQWAPAFLVRHDKVVALGSKEELDMIAHRPKYVDLAGNVVYPGFSDSHVHLLGLGLILQNLRLEGVTLGATLKMVQDRAEKAHKGAWIEGWGFNYNDWPEGRPNKAWLDQVAPYNPVILRAKDGHLIWVNSAALDVCRINQNTPDPPNGLIERDEDGELTGLLMENAIPLVTDNIPDPSEQDCFKGLEAALRLMHSYGIVAVHDMEDDTALKALQQYRERQGLSLRVWMCLPRESLKAAASLGIRSGFGDAYLRIGGVKAFADGALGAGTAWTLEPYEGTSNFGLPTLPLNEINKLVQDANSNGLPVVVHAIGDAANRAVLDAIARFGNRSLRNRLEHVQLLAEADIPRLAHLEVAASMQPTQCPQDRYMADKLWGDRCQRAYAFKSLLRQGTVLAFGSDAPVEDPNVLVGLYSAVARKRWNEPNTEAWYPNEAISMWDALRAFTYGGAYAAGEESYRGTLAPGMLADFTVLTRDILSSDNPEVLKETEVAATFVGGKCVYKG